MKNVSHNVFFVFPKVLGISDLYRIGLKNTSKNFRAFGAFHRPVLLPIRGVVTPPERSLQRCCLYHNVFLQTFFGFLCKWLRSVLLICLVYPSYSDIPIPFPFSFFPPPSPSLPSPLFPSLPFSLFPFLPFPLLFQGDQSIHPPAFRILKVGEIPKKLGEKNTVAQCCF